MNKKIGTFLMFMMVLCAVLILMATASREPYTTPTETPAATTVPAGTKEPEPSAVQTQPTIQEDVPLAAPPAESGNAASRVARILEGSKLGKTASTRLTEDPGLSKADGTEGTGKSSMAHALAELAQERKMNPIAAFWMLVKDGAYEREKLSAPFSLGSFQAVQQEARQYPYTDEGARQLITDLLALAARMEDDLGVELAVLGANLSLEPDQVSYSKADGCRYAYVSAASDRSTHILCFYLRSDEKGQQITDLEFQLLSMRHATGDAEALKKLDAACDRQAAALMAASELLMTGSTAAAGGQIPASYTIGTVNAKLERFAFAAEGEQGTLTNYRLR